VCSVHPCSVNVCSVVACSAAVACSARPCTAAVTVICNVPATVCGAVTVACGPVTVTVDTDPGDPVESIGTLAALKAQLKQQLATIEEQEKSFGESLKPQTVAEVDDLQAKLQGAMEELKTRRAELEKQEKNKGKEPAK
jgi:hypothetical protein